MNTRRELIKITQKALEGDTFVSLVMTKPTSASEINKVTVRAVEIKEQEMLSIVSSYDTRDVTKNYPTAEALQLVQKLLEKDYINARLRTTEANYQIDQPSPGKDKLHTTEPTAKTAPSKSHNKEKARLVAVDRPFLQAVGIVNSFGDVKAKMNGKYAQVESFISVLSNAIKDSSLAAQSEITVYDMGAGSGFVTFATYDHLVESLGKKAAVVGVDIDANLVAQNNESAKELGFDGLSFVTSTISELADISADVTIALHACNTATDDALFAGMQSDSEIIIVSPCCHQEMRTVMKTPKVLEPMHKFGTQKEIDAVMLTDTIRTLILEINGYKTSLFEFVSDEHTGKNNIIVAVKKQSNQDKNKFESQLTKLKEFYGIESKVYIETLTKEQS